MKLEREKERASVAGGCSLSYLPGRNGKMFLINSWKHLVAKAQWHWTLYRDIAWKGNMAKKQCITILGYVEATLFHKVEVVTQLF